MRLKDCFFNLTWPSAELPVEQPMKFELAEER